MMFYVADTHALIKYLTGILPKKTQITFKECERGIHTIFIPTIVLAESFYLIKRGKIKLDFEEMISKIQSSENFVIIPFDIRILRLFSGIKEFEIHDKIIVATAKYLNANLITQDKKIVKSKDVETIW